MVIVVMKRIVVIRSQGRIIIPKDIREKMGGLKEGTSLMLTTYPSNTERPTKILLEVIT